MLNRFCSRTVRRMVLRLVLTIACVVAVPVLADPMLGPVPIGPADVTFTYMTDAGPRVLQSSMDYSARGPRDTIPLGGDPNILYFNSANFLGRRLMVEGLVHDDESLLTHAFFKPGMMRTDFFRDMQEGSDLTLEVQNIHFEDPVLIQRDTHLMHKMWPADQVDMLEFPYVNVQNHETGSDPFRDYEEFFPRLFTDEPVPNYRLGTLDVSYFGDGTDTIGFRVTVPYSYLENFENVDQKVPEGLSAPFGFLEPVHFHYEFVVRAVPEPTTVWLMVLGVPALVRRRR